MSIAEGAQLPISCGTEGCEEGLVRKGEDACCPVHGVMIEGVFKPRPPLEGHVHLNYGGGRGEWVDVEKLRRSVAGMIRPAKPRNP
jgi:hypothetical protein